MNDKNIGKLCGLFFNAQPVGYLRMSLRAFLSKPKGFFFVVCLFFVRARISCEQFTKALVKMHMQKYIAVLPPASVQQKQANRAFLKGISGVSRKSRFFSSGWHALDIFRSWQDSASPEGRAYRGINVIELIGDPGCPVKVTLVIIYAKDDTLLAVCHSAVQMHLLLTLFRLLLEV